MQNFIVLKTRSENLGIVVDRQKHALRGKLKGALPGDILLLAEIRTKGPALVQYAMRLRDQRLAAVGETEKLWGKHWPVVIERDGCRKLDRPFSPEEHKVSSKSYAKGGPVVYVDAEDARAFSARGLLSPLL